MLCMAHEPQGVASSRCVTSGSQHELSSSCWGNIQIFLPGKDGRFPRSDLQENRSEVSMKSSSFVSEKTWFVCSS